LFPFLDVHVSQAFDGFVAPGEAEVFQFGIEHDTSASGAFSFNIVFPELNGCSAGRAPVFFDVFRSPETRIHTGTLFHRHIPLQVIFIK
jgi:hypothetical protein